MIDYLQTLNENIARLIIKRANASVIEQKRINEKLDKLYELKYVTIMQKYS